MMTYFSPFFRQLPSSSWQHQTAVIRIDQRDAKQPQIVKVDTTDAQFVGRLIINSDIIFNFDQHTLLSQRLLAAEESKTASNEFEVVRSFPSALFPESVSPARSLCSPQEISSDGASRSPCPLLERTKFASDHGRVIGDCHQQAIDLSAYLLKKKNIVTLFGQLSVPNTSIRIEFSTAGKQIIHQSRVEDVLIHTWIIYLV